MGCKPKTPIISQRPVIKFSELVYIFLKGPEIADNKARRVVDLMGPLPAASCPTLAIFFCCTNRLWANLRSLYASSSSRCCS